MVLDSIFSSIIERFYDPSSSCWRWGRQQERSDISIPSPRRTVVILVAVAIRVIGASPAGLLLLLLQSRDTAPVAAAAATEGRMNSQDDGMMTLLVQSCKSTSFLPMASASLDTFESYYTNLLLQQNDTTISTDSTKVTTDGYLKWLAITNGIIVEEEEALDESPNKNKYHGKMYIPTRSDSCNGLAFHWGVDKAHSKIHIAVAVRALGWAAFGISLTGGMVGSDIVYVEESPSPSSGRSTIARNDDGGTGAARIYDAHVLDYNSRPVLDDGPARQDWALKGFQKTHDGYLIFEAERALDTGDSQDLIIVDDSIPYVAHHKIIGAWGDGTTISYHGNNRVQSSIQFFPFKEKEEVDDGTSAPPNKERGSDNVYHVFLNEMDRRSEGHVDLILDSYNVLLQTTRYEDVCFSQSKLMELGLPLMDNGTNSSTSSSTDTNLLYLVGYEFLIPTICTKYLHHIVVYGMTAAFNTNPNECSIISSNPVFGWTPGEDFAYFPDNAGIAIGGMDGFNAFLSQYHFDNRDMDVGASCDNSGVRMYFTTQPQEHEIGAIQIGDPLVGIRGMKIGEGFSRHTFDCPSTCSNHMFSGAPDGKVTVIQEILHMHSLGKKVVNQIVRNGNVIHEAKTDFWDFSQSGLKTVQQKPYTLQKGDEFRTTCFYKANDSDVFGYGSQEEMCMAFLLYFPRQNKFLASTCGTNEELKYYIPQCFANHTSKSLDTIDQLGRTFGSLLPLGTGGGMGPFTPSQAPVATSAATRKRARWSLGILMSSLIFVLVTLFYLFV